MTDDLLFRDEEPDAGLAHKAWPLLVVDDDPEVHAVTTLALSGFTFAGRPLHFLHANSAAEARPLLEQRHDIALVLLDVVMETDQAGLDLVKFIRSQLHNRFVRIVLRTGQPGQAPELDVIQRYDINDYKYKTELTRERLFTTVYTSLSTYRDLLVLDANRRGLEKVIEASAHIFELRSMEHFAQGVLEQLAALLFLDCDAVMLHVSGVAAKGNAARLHLIAGIGAYRTVVDQDAPGALPERVLERIRAALQTAGPLAGEHYFVAHNVDAAGDELVFYLDAGVPLPAPDRRLLELFCQNVTIARENVRLLQRAAGPAA